MDGDCSASPPPDSSYASAGSGDGASEFLANLPSRGHFSSTVSSSNLGGMRVCICDHDTSPPEDQIIGTNQTNILIRSLMLKNQKADSCSKDRTGAAANQGSRKRAAEKALDGKAAGKKAMPSTQLGSSQGGISIEWILPLLEVMQRIVYWRKRSDLIHDEARIPWSASHLSVVLGYISKLEFNSEFSALCGTNLCPDELVCCGSDPDSYEKVAQKVVAFTLNLQQFFMVPKLHQLSETDKTLKKNELVAAFIIFLLQLLYAGTSLIFSFEDRIDILKKDMRFLNTVLGDTPLMLGADESEEVQNLLAEFEAVANEAGSLVHSFIFTSDLEQIKSLDVLLKHIDLLKGSIITFLNVQSPYIHKPYTTPKAATVVSFFFVDLLLHDLEDLINQEGNLFVDVKGLMKILHQELMLSQCILTDIKAPRHSEIEELKEPVLRIRDLAYEAEYLINSFSVGDAPLWYLTIRFPDVIHKIKLIRTELQEINIRYDFGALKVAEDFRARRSLRAKGHSESDDIIVGFEDKTVEILDQLTGGTEHLQIISIFGMPGLGKTTLAKKLYNDPLVNYYFHKRLWSVVSQTYQRIPLFIDLLRSSTGELDNDTILTMDKDKLAEHIYKSLKGRRYLIVMDDIWSSTVWDELRRCFPDDGNGSRILLTSRNKDLAPLHSIIHELPPLSNDECWLLLEKKVFYCKPCPPQLLGIGKEIAANCYGLPLVVVVIAGILSTMDKEESTWKNVGESLDSYICNESNNSIMQILELSYKHLPHRLKPCFLYLGAFPHEKEIPVRKLMKLWIGEGFIRREDHKSLESVAEEYLKELIDKSLVIVAKRRSDGGAKACVIHDLLRDLCLRTAEEENFLKLIDKLVDNNYSILVKKHSMNTNSPQLLQPFGQHVRSFIGYFLDSPPHVLNMRSLKILDLSTMSALCDLIGIELLVQLRYLAISHMPTSIGNLVNLEFLLMKSSSLVCISLVILKMVKLKYFDSKQAIFMEDCYSSQMSNLQSLSTVEVNEFKDEEMLKCLPHLRKLKCICKPFLDEQGAYRYPDLHFLTQLESLNMKFKENKLVEINFPSNIRKLTLSCSQLPWEKISLVGRLPNLEILKLQYNAFHGERWDTRDGEFQQLRVLKLIDMGLTEWNASSSEHFPKLQQLVLHDCYRLHEIPCEIGEIVTMQLIEVKWCQKSALESAMRIQEEQREMGNEELRVIISKPFIGFDEDFFPSLEGWELENDERGRKLDRILMSLEERLHDP